MKLKSFLKQSQISFTANKEETSSELIYIPEEQLELELSITGLANFLGHLQKTEYWHKLPGRVSSGGELKLDLMVTIKDAVVKFFEDVEASYLPILKKISKYQQSYTEAHRCDISYSSYDSIGTWRQMYCYGSLPLENHISYIDSNERFKFESSALFRVLNNLAPLPHTTSEEIEELNLKLPKVYGPWMPIASTQFMVTRYNNSFYDAMDKHVHKSRITKDRFKSNNVAECDIVCYVNLSAKYLVYVDMLTLEIYGVVPKGKGHEVSPENLMIIAAACGHNLV